MLLLTNQLFFACTHSTSEADHISHFKNFMSSGVTQTWTSLNFMAKMTSVRQKWLGLDSIVILIRKKVLWVSFQWRRGYVHRIPAKYRSVHWVKVGDPSWVSRMVMGWKHELSDAMFVLTVTYASYVLWHKCFCFCYKCECLLLIFLCWYYIVQ